MAEETRMSKFKDLRENIDEETDYEPQIEDESDDDFLSFLPNLFSTNSSFIS